MIKWGIIGLGNIAQRFIRGLSYSEEGYLYAGASHDLVKRDQFQDKHPMARVYETYEQLLDDPTVDAVYIAVRHADHYRFAASALNKKKAVLCEKPATLNTAETRRLCSLSEKNQVFFMEALKTRFVPLMDEIAELDLGRINRVVTSFCGKQNYDPNKYLFDPKQGGVLFDVGTYNIGMTIWWIRSQLSDVQVSSKQNYGVDTDDLIELKFASGQSASLEISMSGDKPRKMIVYGSNGILEAEPFYRPEKATVTMNNAKPYIIQNGYLYDDFYTEIVETEQCIKRGEIQSTKMPHIDSILCAEIIDRIRDQM